MVMKIYNSLLENGWTLNEIDSCDIHFYIELMNYKQKPKIMSIEDLKW